MSSVSGQSQTAKDQKKRLRALFFRLRFWRSAAAAIFMRPANHV
jgi:hypothetical protein